MSGNTKVSKMTPIHGSTLPASMSTRTLKVSLPQKASFPL